MTWTCALCECSSAGTAVKRAYRNSPLCSWCFAELQRTGRGYCPRCRASVPLGDMSSGYCKPHRREQTAAYRERHREKIRAYQRSVYRTPELTPARRAICRAAQARYFQRHKDRVNEQRRRRRANNPGEWRRYYWANAERMRAQLRARRIKKKLAILRGWR